MRGTPNTSNAPAVRLALPATSANLGPGFDALGLALDFALHVEAAVAGRTSLRATGRSADLIADAENSLLLATCRDVLRQEGTAAPPLDISLHNEIPLGMGCGSSAAALVAGVALAAHFGGLGWSRSQILTEASRREGHPDNVAACVLGGLTVSAMRTGSDGRQQVDAVSVPLAVRWPVIVAMPHASLSTSAARALLPATYTRVDAVANVQATSLLVAAFATGRGDLLATAMQDRMHQPYRCGMCPLLPALLPLAGRDGILGVALSGAGPSVLLLLHPAAAPDEVLERVRRTAADAGMPAEVLLTAIAGAARLGVD